MNLSELLRNNHFFNPLHEHVSMFAVKNGEKIETGDSIVVDPKTLLAMKPTENSGYVTVGFAKKVIQQEHGVQSVICIDGIHITYNPCGDISEDDIGSPCYFVDADNVTLNGTNRTKAGIIEGIEFSDDPADIEDGMDRIVFIKMNLTEGSGLTW